MLEFPGGLNAMAGFQLRRLLLGRQADAVSRLTASRWPVAVGPPGASLPRVPGKVAVPGSRCAALRAPGVQGCARCPRLGCPLPRGGGQRPEQHVPWGLARAMAGGTEPVLLCGGVSRPGVGTVVSPLGALLPWRHGQSDPAL